jgi:2-keto-4-pentenoate hydratase/2-oxohepta-3-ene-1,7-dioic acid hydratase in catechol pathway
MSVRAVTFKGSRDALRVGKILCLGRNYREHAREMKAEVPTVPVVFLKPATALVASGETIIIPPVSREMHYETEMVVVIGKDGKAIPAERALDYVAGYGIGLDMTLRDVQAEAKAKGLPWTVAKGFDTSAPVSEIVPRGDVVDPGALELRLTVNGELRQRGNTREMIFSVEQIIAYLSTIFTLERGDLIFTGTPEGVGAAHSGDQLAADLGTLARLTVHVR